MRYSLIFLLLCFSVLAQYVAPNEETVIIVGGLGTQASASDNNGGGATKAVWDAGTPADFIGTNGAPISTSAAVTFTTATKNLSAVNIGLNVVVGTLLQVTVGGDGSHVTLGIYEVTTVTDNDNIICLQIDDDGTNDVNLTVNVGGALDTLQEAWDNPVNDGTAFKRNIYNNVASVDIGAVPIDNDTNSGSVTTVIYTTGYNATLTAEATVIITTTGNIATGLVDFSNGVVHHNISNIDFNGGGVGLAEHCIYNNTDTEGEIVFKNCLIHNADNSGALIGGTTDADQWLFVSCEIYDNGQGPVGSGIAGRIAARGRLSAFGCKVYDNADFGLSAGQPMEVVGCQIYGNGDSGCFISDDTVRHLITNNTIYGNGGDGIELTAGAGGDFSVKIYNNTSVANVGFGYNLAGLVPGAINVFSNNHSFNNDSGGTPNSATSHCSETSTLALFQVFGQGDNFSGDPLFTNPGADNFIPTSSSPLIDAGVGGTGDTIGALCATAGGAGGEPRSGIGMGIGG